jgi:predicted ATP-dependent endonuclease of OLD family
MNITQIQIQNFRLLKKSTLSMKTDLSILIGRNNSGKTSFLVLFEKFYNNLSFNYNDFPISMRETINHIDEDTKQKDLTIQMSIKIKYDAQDNLENISEFILDLDDNCDIVNILFEAYIDKFRLIKDLSKQDPKNKERYIRKYLKKYILQKIYVFESDEDLERENRYKLVEKKLQDIKKIINFQIIHAKRNVSSSDENSQKTKILSFMTTKYFNEKNKDNDFDGINEQMIKMDEDLNKIYARDFDSFLQTAKDFLGLDDLKVISNLESNEILQNSSHVVYGSNANYLPEHLNGLGYMNILYLLLQIEMIKENFQNEKKDINLFFIEEPEAHTHPQMQYVFAKKIKSLLASITSLQTVMTTHSAHIVSQCDFEDIRYLLKNEIGDNITIKNFHTELKAKYTEQEEFKFIEQYLTLQSSELFFANKIIFIEGITERILLPYFIKLIDKENNSTKQDYKPLSSQNISILEVGANAKVFDKFLNFLNIKTLIITDIDTTKKIINDTTKRTTYNACKVAKGEYTSNGTIKHFLQAPKIDSPEWHEWFESLKNNKLQKDNHNINIKIAYQTEENSYHARSFEDAFLSVNLQQIRSYIAKLDGLKRINEVKTTHDIYDLTEKLLDKKSYFASSLLYLALSEDNLEWKIPKYIKDGLNWIVQ